MLMNSQRDLQVYNESMSAVDVDRKSLAFNGSVTLETLH